MEQLRELCADFPMKVQQNAALRAEVHKLEALVATHDALLRELASKPPRGHPARGGALTPAARRMAPAGPPARVRARCPPSGGPPRATHDSSAFLSTRGGVGYEHDTGVGTARVRRGGGGKTWHGVD